MMANYPARGSKPWDTLLKAYIDQVIAAAGNVNNAAVAALVSGVGATRTALRTLIGTEVSTPATPANDAVISTVNTAVAAAAVADRYVSKAMVEYRWILPTSVYQDEPYRHTMCAALGDSDGTNTQVLLIDASHESGNTVTYVVGTVPADDHNAPSVIAAPGDPIVMQWTKHGLIDVTYPNGHPFMYYKVGVPDRPDTLVTAPLQIKDMGASTSYGQAWRVDHLTTDEKIVNYRLYRRNLTEWYLLTEEIDRSSLLVTTNAPGVRLVSGNGLQCYVTTARGSRDSQVLRFGFYTSPASEPDWVKYFELDMVTGAITSPFDVAFSANLNGTNLPLTPDTTPQFLPNLTGAKVAYERRMFAVRPWPGAEGVLTAEGDPNARAATAHYWLHEWAGAFTAPSTGNPSPATGLIIPNGSPGLIKTTNIILANGQSGIQVDALIQLPAVKPTDTFLDITGQMNDASSTSGWQIWLGATTNELRPRIIVNRVGNVAQAISSTVAVPYTWGQTFWLRTIYTVASTGSPARRITWLTSAANDGVAFTELANNAGSSGALVVESDAYTYVGSRATDRADDMVVKAIRISVGGVLRSEMDFTSDAAGAINWPGYAAAHTDAQSNTWSVSGAAYVGRTAYGRPIPPEAIPVSRDLGPVGAAPDYASYYAGAAFSGDSVLLARTVGANQELVVSDYATGALRESVIRTQATTAGKYFRPMPPDNGGPLWCWLINVTDYGDNEYFDWESGGIAVRRL